MRFFEASDWSLEEQLDQSEQILKSLYEENHSLLPELPHEADVYTDVFAHVPDQVISLMPKGLLTKRLAEQTFFQTSDNIELFRHLRYLPCCWHSHDFLEIICVIRGSCRHYIAEQEMELIEGDICIVAPDTNHALSVFSDDGIILNVLIRVSTFETAFFSTLADDNVLSRFFHHTLYHSKTYPYLLFRAGQDQKLFNFVGYAYEEARAKNHYKRQMLDAIMSGFFVMLLRNHGADVIVPELESIDHDKNLVYILKYLQEHYNTTSLPEMAAFFNYSERQIQRLIISTTGISFSANILRLKMDQAERLLANSDMSVADIAAELGYMDPRNFRQAFKKYCGQTPTEYRQRMR